MNGLVEFVKTLGAARIAAMVAVTVALIGFFGFVIMRLSAPAMAPLFTELSIEDSSRVIKELESQGIPFQLRADGSTILIPKDNVTRFRMRLAEAGLPRGGSVGYEIFDKTDTLGTTSFVQNVNHLRALEGELARTIRSIDRIAAARVHLVVPDRQLFQRDRQEPSASIVLRVRSQLEQAQVRAIRHLTASAVRGLKPERISIVDEQGRLLADGAMAGESGTSLALGIDERNTAFENRMRTQIESIISSVVGPGRARVQVSAEMDYSRVQQTSDSYDPESRVIRSTQSREEAGENGSSGTDGAVSVGNELPGGQQRGGQQQAQSRDSSRKNEETVNYEISRTTRVETLEPGRVKRLSVAVLVDGNYTKAANSNEMTYAPRTQEELDRITALVRTAIGFNQSRGDMVEVVNLRFAEVPGVPQIAEPGGLMSMLRFTTDDIMYAVNLVVVAILSLLVLLFVVRPLVRRIVTPDEAALAQQQAPAVLMKSEGAVETASPPVQPNLDNAAARMIEFAQMQGDVHQQSIQKVGELATRNPYETVSIIRQWMHEKQA